MARSARRPRLKDVLKTKPMGFQFEGIRRLYKLNGRAILGDEMGLGKTLQVLGWLAINPKARPVVVVCPANAKFVWHDQILEHTHMDCQVLFGRTPTLTTAPILIINYEIVQYWEKYLLSLKPKVLILDECHYVKTRNIKRTKTCKRLASAARHVIPMSGTPIINRPVEYFPVLNMVYPKEFKSFWKYAFRYCDPKRGWAGRGWNFNGASHTKELHKRTKPFLIRRKKKDVLKELPDKRRSVLPVDISNLKEYNYACDDFLSWVKKVKGKGAKERAAKAEAFVKIGQLKRLAALGKLKAAEQWIADFLETTDEKLVVFCHHQEVFQELYKRFKKISARGGSQDRAGQVKKFQKKKSCRLFIGTIKADGTAITLTRSSTVLFLELGWTPGEHDQAEDRVHRIGQQKKTNIYYMLARDTIDLRVWEMIEEKRKVIGKILDGKAVLDPRVSFNAIIKMVRR